MSASFEGTSPPPEDSSAPPESDVPETVEVHDETGEASGTEGTSELHGAEDPREFRLNYPDEYIEPMSRARPVEPFQHPSVNLEHINPNFPEGIEYRVNCADCARNYEATWRGQEQEAAGRANLEGEYPERTEAWAHEKFTPTDPDELRASLEQGGHGSSAYVVSHFGDTSPKELRGHAYNVVNHNGEIITVDSQLNEYYEYSNESIHPLLEDYDRLYHRTMAWDAQGRRIL